MGLTQIILALVLFGIIYGAMFIRSAMKRFYRLGHSSRSVQAKVIGKQYGRTEKALSKRHYPDFTNGVYILEYSYTDPDGHEHVNATHISQEMYDATNEGDEIEVRVDEENWADNKAYASLDRDYLACKGIFVTLLFVGIVLVGVLGWLSLPE